MGMVETFSNSAKQSVTRVNMHYRIPANNYIRVSLKLNDFVMCTKVALIHDWNNLALNIRYIFRKLIKGEALINGEAGIFFRINKQGGPNKSVEGGKILELNSRACPSIRDRDFSFQI